MFIYIFIKFFIGPLFLINLLARDFFHCRKNSLTDTCAIASVIERWKHWINVQTIDSRWSVYGTDASRDIEKLLWWLKWTRFVSTTVSLL